MPPNKVGLDDFLSDGGSVDELRARVERDGVRVDADSQNGQQHASRLSVIEPASDPARYFGPGQEKKIEFYAAVLGEEACEAGHLRRGPDHRLYRYDRGLYKADGELFVQDFARDRLGVAFSKKRLGDVLDWCRAHMPSIPEHPDRSTINCANGLLDWRTDELRPHTPEEPSIHQIPVTWDGSARCPRIEQFLGEVLPPDAVPLFFEISGYCIYGGQPLRKAFLYTGEGGNGKSTALALQRSLVGAQNVSTTPLQKFGESRFAAAQLHGKLANIAGDLDARALKHTDQFKTLTGGTDCVEGERKYQHPFSFVPYATMLFSANEIPASVDQSQAYFDRFIVLPFPNRFEGTERNDPHLLKALTTSDELSGFLTRAVEGLRALMVRGRFDLPESVIAAGAAFRAQVDTVGAFIEEMCVLEPSAVSDRRPLLDTYQSWCRGELRVPVSSQAFTERIRKQPGVTQRVVGGVRGWRGIRLRTQRWS